MATVVCLYNSNASATDSSLKFNCCNNSCNPHSGINYSVDQVTQSDMDDVDRFINDFLLGKTTPTVNYYFPSRNNNSFFNNVQDTNNRKFSYDVNDMKYNTIDHQQNTNIMKSNIKPVSYSNNNIYNSKSLLRNNTCKVFSNNINKEIQYNTTDNLNSISLNNHKNTNIQDNMAYNTTNNKNSNIACEAGTLSTNNIDQNIPHNIICKTEVLPPIKQQKVFFPIEVRYTIEEDSNNPLTKSEMASILTNSEINELINNRKNTKHKILSSNTSLNRKQFKIPIKTIRLNSNIQSNNTQIRNNINKENNSNTQRETICTKNKNNSVQRYGSYLNTESNNEQKYGSYINNEDDNIMQRETLCTKYEDNNIKQRYCSYANEENDNIQKYNKNIKKNNKCIANNIFTEDYINNNKKKNENINNKNEKSRNIYKIEQTSSTSNNEKCTKNNLYGEKNRILYKIEKRISKNYTRNINNLINNNETFTKTNARKKNKVIENNRNISENNSKVFTESNVRKKGNSRNVSNNNNRTFTQKNSIEKIKTIKTDVNPFANNNKSRNNNMLKKIKIPKLEIEHLNTDNIQYNRCVTERITTQNSINSSGSSNYKGKNLRKDVIQKIDNNRVKLLNKKKLLKQILRKSINTDWENGINQNEIDLFFENIKGSNAFENMKIQIYSLLGDVAPSFGDTDKIRLIFDIIKYNMSNRFEKHIYNYNKPLSLAGTFIDYYLNNIQVYNEDVEQFTYECNELATNILLFDIEDYKQAMEILYYNSFFNVINKVVKGVNLIEEFKKNRINNPIKLLKLNVSNGKRQDWFITTFKLFDYALQYSNKDDAIRNTTFAKFNNYLRNKSKYRNINEEIQFIPTLKSFVKENKEEFNEEGTQVALEALYREEESDISCYGIMGSILMFKIFPELNTVFSSNQFGINDSIIDLANKFHFSSNQSLAKQFNDQGSQLLDIAFYDNGRKLFNNTDFLIMITNGLTRDKVINGRKYISRYNNENILKENQSISSVGNKLELYELIGVQLCSNGNTNYISITGKELDDTINNQSELGRICIEKKLQPMQALYKRIQQSEYDKYINNNT